MTIASVQAFNNIATTSPNFTVSVTTGVTQGNLLVVCMNEGNAIAFGAPAGWTLCTTQTSEGACQTAMAWVIVTAGMAGSTSFTFNIASGSHSVAWTIREWNSTTGWAATPADQQVATPNTGSATVTTGTSGSTTAAVELVVAALGWASGSSVTTSGLTAGYTAGTGYSAGSDTTTLPVNNSTNNGLYEAYLITSSHGHPVMFFDSFRF